MWAEGSYARHRGAVACALITALIVSVLGGGGAAVLIAAFEQRMADSAREDMALVGDSLARSLAQRYARAARYGIPLDELPGIDAHLGEALAQTRGIARITLVDAQGRTLGTAQSGPGDDTLSAPVEVGEDTLARIDVTIRPVALVGGAGAVRRQVAVAVALIAVIAAISAGLWVGRQIDRRHDQLGAALAAVADGHPPPGPRRWHGHDAVVAAFTALHGGAQRLETHRHELDAYAAELLAVDFDDQLRPSIQHVLARAAAPIARGGAD